MKARKIIGGIAAITGMMLAICTPDECKNEIAMRFVGIAIFALGAFFGKYFDFQQNKQ